MFIGLLNIITVVFIFHNFEGSIVSLNSVYIFSQVIIANIISRTFSLLLL